MCQLKRAGGSGITYHRFLFLLQLQMEIGGCQRTGVPKRPWPRAHASVVAH